MINFYKKIFRIFCRVSDNPKAMGGNHPENSAFVATSVLCIFNFLCAFLLIKGIVFRKSWNSTEKLITAVVDIGIGIGFYYIFLYNEKYKEYIAANTMLDSKTKRKENIFLTLYIIGTFAALIAVPVLNGFLIRGRF